MAKISRINGSFYTIMGLPTHLVYETLKELNSKKFPEKISYFYVFICCSSQ
jgi:hypothetical protein